MIFIYSNDQTLVSLCMELFKSRYGAKHLSSKTKLSESNIGEKDILIIDFNSCNEKELPRIIGPCMALVSIPQKDQALRLLRRGIRAYGNRYMHEKNLSQAIATLKAGQIWLPPAILAQMISVLPYTKTQEKEKNLLQHLTSIFKKTGCRNRLEFATRMK
jgi:DNA-binding NarL/FixJ family response regulator